ncbi:hypothetical protein EVAR_103706_1 [Eumeta japonica]|uniref:Uncharacterized protein n=1 Tax=Eumeta variegata TaxID=151549 RepID=A0A4C1ZLP2_EUMVA|nr:hypothetical protein EVAR_103706_1 [Eumeta japonica]
MRSLLADCGIATTPPIITTSEAPGVGARCGRGLGDVESRARSTLPPALSRYAKRPLLVTHITCCFPKNYLIVRLAPRLDHPFPRSSDVIKF